MFKDKSMEICLSTIYGGTFMVTTIDDGLMDMPKWYVTL